MGLVNCAEPFTNLLSQGMVTMHSPLSGRIEKMSKSRGNVVGTLDFFKKYGADAARLFTLFAAPPEQELEWNEDSAVGQYRFLGRIWRLVDELLEKGCIDSKQVGAAIDTEKLDPAGKALIKQVHKAVKAVSTDLGNEHYGFNTAIARCMELVNALYKYVQEAGQTLQGPSPLLTFAIRNLLLIIAPMAPHISEELWHLCGFASGAQDSIHTSSWPQFDEALTIDQDVELVLQVNGKIVNKVGVARGLDRQSAEDLAFGDDKMKAKLGGAQVRKVIVVPDKLVNVVI